MSSAVEVLKGFIICSDEVIRKDRFSEQGYKTLLEDLNKAVLALEFKQKCEDDIQSMVMVAEDKAKKQGAIKELKRMESKVGHKIISKVFYDYIEKRLLELEKEEVKKK